MRVAFVVSGLATGGAEMMLYKLLKTLAPARVQPLVISLGRCGRPASLIEGLGITVLRLRLDERGAAALPHATLTAYRSLKRFEPELLSGWMYHGNLMAWALACLLKVPLAWNIRQTLNLSQEKAMTQRVIRFGAYLSRTPAKLMYVSHQARAQHRALGYFDERAVVLPNGFEVDLWRRDAAEGKRLRSELSIDDQACVVGHLARFHPMKDQIGLLEAARRVAAEEPAVRFVLAGEGLSASNATLATAVRRCGLAGRVMLLGETAAPQRLLSACDVFCLPSAWGEGFPNAVGEAMACELPCVVTRIGEGPDLVDTTGVVVEPGDHEALARAILQLVRAGPAVRSALGAQARARIATHFSLAQVAAHYAEMFEAAAGSTA